MTNPFITSGYAGSRYFCDRITETDELRSLLRNENNIALISQRRLGKTELIHHVFDCDDFRSNYHCFIVDVYATKNLSDFVNVFGKVVLDEIKLKGRKVWTKFVDILSSIKSEITFDINGNPVWSVGLGNISNPSVTLDEIFHYLNNADKPCLVAIDEFQQITKYNDPNVEAALRTYVQRSVNAHFIFSGSQRHIMDGMFTSPARPFYQSVTVMNLQPISLEKYAEFAKEKFTESGRILNDEVVPEIYSRFFGVTSYMHRILNVLYSRTEVGTSCSIGMVDDAIDYVIHLSSDTYESLLYQMPEKQRTTFLAIASEGKAKEITGGAFLKKHKLPSASSVVSAVKGLLDKDFITVDRGVYSGYDQFFVIWLNKKGII